MTLERRDLLRLTGATAVASTVGITGCLGEDDSTEDDPADTEDPTYRDWLVTDDDGALVVASVDWSALKNLDSSVTNLTEGNYESADGSDPFAKQEDLLLAAPLVGAVLVGLGTVGTFGTGLDGLVGNGDPLQGIPNTDDAETSNVSIGGTEDVETTVDEVFWVNEAYVMAGDVNTDEIHDILTAKPDGEYGVKAAYERTSEIGAFAVYEPAEDSPYEVTESAVAVNEDAVVVSMGSTGDPAEQFRGPLEAASGETTRAVDDTEEINWLVETAGRGHVTFGSYGDLDDQELEPDGEYEELSGATGFIGTLTIDGSSESSGTFAATFDDLDADTEAELEATLGTSAADASLEFDGDRMVANATWDENALAASDVTDD